MYTGIAIVVCMLAGMWSSSSTKVTETRPPTEEAIKEDLQLMGRSKGVGLQNDPSFLDFDSGKEMHRAVPFRDFGAEQDNHPIGFQEETPSPEGGYEGGELVQLPTGIAKTLSAARQAEVRRIVDIYRKWLDQSIKSENFLPGWNFEFEEPDTAGSLKGQITLDNGVSVLNTSLDSKGVNADSRITQQVFGFKFLTLSVQYDFVVWTPSTEKKGTVKLTVGYQGSDLGQGAQVMVDVDKLDNGTCRYEDILSMYLDINPDEVADDDDKPDYYEAAFYTDESSEDRNLTRQLGVIINTFLLQHTTDLRGYATNGLYDPNLELRRQISEVVCGANQ